MRFCHPFRIDGQREHPQCTGVREKKSSGGRACSWNAVYVNPFDFSYGMCLGQ